MMGARFQKQTKAKWLVLLAWISGTSHGTSDFSKFQMLYESSSDANETFRRLEKMEALRSSAQASLENLLKSGRGNALELELRYAELLVQRGRDLDLWSMELAALNQSEKSKLLSAQGRDLMTKGLSIHTKLLSRAKGHPLAPSIYLGMARTEHTLGRKAMAFNRADEGVRAIQASTPKETVLQLWIARGDAAFDTSKASLALESYSKAESMVKPGSVEDAYVTYKLAWVHYNLKDPVTALAQLDKLFSKASDRFALRAESIQDYALFAADLSAEEYKTKGGHSGIASTLRKQSDDAQVARALERLGLTLSKNGRRSDAIETYLYLISEYPRDAKNVDRALTIVEWSHSLADKSKLTDQYFWLLSQFGQNSPWYLSQSGQAQVQKVALDKIEQSVRTYAVGLHEKANKESTAELRDKAEAVVAKLYDAHIEAFSGQVGTPRAEAARVNYYRAEIHRRHKEWARAGLRYDTYLRMVEQVPESDRPKTDQKLYPQALWDAVEVWAAAQEKDSTVVESFVAAGDRLLDRDPKHAKASQVLLDLAKVELKSGKASVALTRLERLVTQFPKTKEASLAVDAHLDVLNQEKDWGNLALKARAYLDSVAVWASPSELQSSRAELTKILSQTELKGCDALSQRAGSELEAALCFEGFSRGFAKDNEAPKALFLAAELYDKNKRNGSALAALERLVKEYPQSEYSVRAFSRLASAFEKNFEFEKAADIYEILLTRKGEVKDRETIQSRLATIYEAAGNDKKLRTLLARPDVSSSLKSEFERRELRLQMWSWMQDGARAGWTEEFFEKQAARWAALQARFASGKMDALSRLEMRRVRGIVERNRKKLDTADAEWMAGLQEYWKISPKTPEVLEAGARLRLEQASVWETAFRNTDIVSNATRKAELFQKLEKWYGEVIQMKAPTVALEALWASARLNNAFADELRNSEAPAELLAAGQEENLKRYRELLVEKTEPLKKKAITIIETIAAKAEEWGVVSPVVFASAHVVSQLRSGVELPGALVRVEAGEQLRFPWTELPRWMDLDSEELAFEEWLWTDDRLEDQLRAEKRSEQRRAAMVLFARDFRRAKDARVSKWIPTFQSKAGIQLRVQAHLNSSDVSNARLFLEQYVAFFGNDAFANQHWGLMDWTQGNFAGAYQRWIGASKDAAVSKDFRTAYYQLGWRQLLKSLSKQNPSADSDGFELLWSLAKRPSDRHAVALLCLDQKIFCSPKNSDGFWWAALSEATEAPVRREFADGRSGWVLRHQSLERFAQVRAVVAEKHDDLKNARAAVAELFEMSRLTPQSRAALASYRATKNAVEFKEERIDFASKQRAIASERTVP